jgi:hypothetical protein
VRLLVKGSPTEGYTLAGIIPPNDNTCPPFSFSARLNKTAPNGVPLITNPATPGTYAFGATFTGLQGSTARITQDVEIGGEHGEGSLTLVGHNPLMNRGMNAALAIHGNYAYIGSRTDGKAGNQNHMGIMVVDISNPAQPNIVREIGPPLEGNQGESSRELRVWKSQDILIVLHTNCGQIHACGGTSVNSFRFYDISGENAANPKLILQFNQNTHEYFIWEDPFDPNFALMFGGTAGSTMQVWDISPVANGQPPVTLFSGSNGYTGGGIHSLSVSNDGKRAFYALLTGGFAVADVSDFTSRLPSPQPRRITVAASRPTWPGPGAHSAIKLWGRDWVYVADEVYGEALRALGGHGCPWGWARMIDIADPTRPVVKAEYKLPQNNASFCQTDVPRPFSSYSAHNPTATPNLVITSWHSGGLQAIDVSDPANPTQAAEFVPGLSQRPTVVLQEDPVLSSGQDKVVMWSYPIIKDGLIYVIDIRNGLYILKYQGPHEAEVSSTTFLEGNSNQGDALRFEPVPPPTTTP